MSRENMPSFRTSMRGYNKEDINSYIKEMSGDFIAAKEEYEETITDLEHKLEAKDQEISELQCMIAERDAEKAKAEEHDDGSEELISALRLRLDEMTEELSVLRDEKVIAEARASEAERREAEAREAEAEARTLASQARESELSESSRKAEMYDKASVQIGRIMIDARENADAIIAEAEAEAVRIRQSAEAEVSAAKTESVHIREQAERSAYTVIKEAEEKVHQLCAAYSAETADVSKKIIAKYENMVEEMCARLRAVVSEMSAEADKLAASIVKDCSEELSYKAATLSLGCDKVASDMTGTHVAPEYSAYRTHEVAENRMKSACSSCGLRFSESSQEKSAEVGEKRFDLRDEKISLDYGAAD